MGLLALASLRCGGDKGRDINDRLEGGEIPADFTGKSFVATLTSGTRGLQIGIPLVYRFLSNSQVLAEDGRTEYPVRRWSWRPEDDQSGVLELIYRDDRSFERYSLDFQTELSGRCRYLANQYYDGPTPSGDPNEFLEYSGDCLFRLDTVCFPIPDEGQCASTSGCRWDTLDVTPSCLPELRASPPLNCPYQDRGLSDFQVQAHCRAASLAECRSAPGEVRAHCAVLSGYQAFTTYDPVALCPACD